MALGRGLLRRWRHPQFAILPFATVRLDTWRLPTVRLDAWRLDTWRLRFRARGRRHVRVERRSPPSTSPSNELTEEPKCTARGVDEDQ